MGRWVREEGRGSGGGEGGLHIFSEHGAGWSGEVGGEVEVQAGWLTSMSSCSVECHSEGKGGGEGLGLTSSRPCRLE